MVSNDFYVFSRKIEKGLSDQLVKKMKQTLICEDTKREDYKRSHESLLGQNATHNRTKKCVVRYTEQVLGMLEYHKSSKGGHSTHSNATNAS